MPRSSVAALALALAVAVAVVAAPRAGRAAERPRLAILTFNGPPTETVKAQAQLEKLLRKRFELVAQSTWDEAATRLVATSRSADDIGAVAKELGCKVVLTGAIKNDGGWQLVVTIRDVTGKPIEKQRYSLKGPKIEAATLKQMGSDILPLILEKVSGASEFPETPPETRPEPEPTLSPEEQAALDRKKKKDEEKARGEQGAGQQRPAWAHILDAGAGYILSGRGFAFDAPGTETMPRYNSTVASGLRLDLTFYPLALLAKRPGAGINVISGLGIGATADVVFWPASVPRDQTVETCGGAPPCSFATSEFRVEAGLRWHWNFLNKPNRPELLVSFQWGIHNFTVGKRGDGTTVGPPDVTYNYLTIGAGVRIPFIPQLALLVNFNFHPVLDAGGINGVAEFGPGSSYGLRVGGGLEIRPWKGLTFRLAGFYERFALSFTNGGMKPTNVGATDQYYGGWVTVGYAY